MSITYEQDIIAWANEQAALLRAGNFSQLDLENIAEEIEDVGKSEQRELQSRMVILVMHLLKWQFQPERRSRSWQNTIKIQRKATRLHLKAVPSLKRSLSDSIWLELLWTDAIKEAVKETNLDLDIFPEGWLWSIEQVLDDSFLPE